MNDITTGIPFRIQLLPSRGFTAALAPRAASVQPAYTFGWDTAFAIRITDVNRELRKPGVCPPAFDATLPNVCRCQGTFGPWQVAVGDDGGDGTVLRLSAPIRSGRLVF